MDGRERREGRGDGDEGRASISRADSGRVFVERAFGPGLRSASARLVSRLVTLSAVDRKLISLK